MLYKSPCLFVCLGIESPARFYSILFVARFVMLKVTTNLFYYIVLYVKWRVWISARFALCVWCHCPRKRWYFARFVGEQNLEENVLMLCYSVNLFLSGGMLVLFAAPLLLLALLAIINLEISSRTSVFK